MKFIIKNGKYDIFGNGEKFPISVDKIIQLRIGSIGCFGYPNGDILVAVYEDDDHMEHNKIIGRFKDIKVKKSHWFGGIVESVTLIDFESEFTESDVERLIKHEYRKKNG